MADLLSILSGAATSLAAQRALTATASHNIDNANTPGYARQRASLEAITPAEQVNGAFIGRGATLTTVTQARDRFLEAQIPQAMGDAAQSSAQSDALQAFHGLDPEASAGLGSAVSGFYASLRALSQNPSDSGLRTSFLGSSQTLALAFQRTSQEIESSRTGIDAQVSGFAGQVDAEAQAVAQLNLQIRQARASGAEPNDLLDLRQQHLDELAALAGATPVPTSEGDVNVTLPGGAALVAGARAGSLSTQPDPANGGHLAIVLTQADGTKLPPLANAALGGSLGGALAARDGALATAGTQVDEIAFDLAGAVNAKHAAGYGLDGVTGRPLFAVGATSSGAAARIAVALSDPAQLAMASAPGAPGDAGNAEELIATESAPLDPSDPNSKDVQSTLSSVVAQFGAAAQSARAFADQSAALKDHLTGLRDSYSGVSIDEEMIAMQQAQRGYEAIAKVIKTADEMMQTLLDIK
jgi:flagellar hook-associated protein 1 FlgK